MFKLKDVGSVMELMVLASKLGPFANELLKYDDPEDEGVRPEVEEIREDLLEAKERLESARHRMNILLIKAGKEAQAKGIM